MNQYKVKKNLLSNLKPFSLKIQNNKIGINENTHQYE